MKTKTYIIQRMDNNEIVSQKASTPAEAMCLFMDRRYRSWYGPMFIDGVFEIYQRDGMKLKFSVS